MTEQQNANIIELSEEFSAPVETLYQAWTETDHLKKWWSPMGESLEKVTNELNDGGVVSYDFQSGDFKVTGNYEEVKPNEKLVYSWNWEYKNDLPQELYKLTIRFEGTENGSILHVKQEELQNDDVVKSHKDAWRTALDSLKSHLENSGEVAGHNLKSDAGMSDRSGGYNEAPEQAKVGGG
ncbi:Uncharacterized conserved protein YndB, AHSA1/START domain [Dyadobacter koreensis]|uniref:Uncharacterized conserved protein YndB, AHSA1/START domain n=1 Tax=Dyadobacter koreensis TaxID=408657 RepID=A0A1H6YPW6_9BACT|nr:SRPBCC domain-containing protein [Dyadobacter koreensis]SEJ42406.1 Uncharacterized conserved protein YndB, AHSA1/START domain [Dyadobacter koreensis]